ncbi:hypothetical protein AMTR_s00114p00075450 [Amborella trichopoda]|uniref:Uncharacterized protein n=1 Tax=Amborella trichopoda TaxID=13333 RepID=W1NPU9_AMBTC|nr:hypothetical protein AMTR_s00114p00075450 [Amborella trichopoda]
MQPPQNHPTLERETAREGKEKQLKVMERGGALEEPSNEGGEGLSIGSVVILGEREKGRPGEVRVKPCCCVMEGEEMGRGLQDDVRVWAEEEDEGSPCTPVHYCPVQAAVVSSVGQCLQVRLHTKFLHFALQLLRCSFYFHSDYPTNTKHQL